MENSTEIQTRLGRSRFRPRFTLAALLALVTVSALGAWYWWRVPFEVEVQGKGNRTVETVRRVWGGRTMRHGPVREFDKEGRKVAEIQYREGILQGPSRWFDSQEQIALTLRFERGKLVGPIPIDVESGIANRLDDADIADDLLTQTLLQTAPVKFLETPFKDCMEFLEAQHGFPVEIDAKNMEENGISLDTPVSIEESRLPLIATLGRILKPLELTCDYRYGSIFVTSPEQYTRGDRSGIYNIQPPPGSRLAAVWDKPVKIEFLERPLVAALGHIAELTGGAMRFDVSHLPKNYHDIPVTRTMELPPRHFLAVTLNELELQAEPEGEMIVLKRREPNGRASESESR